MLDKLKSIFPGRADEEVLTLTNETLVKFVSDFAKLLADEADERREDCDEAELAEYRQAIAEEPSLMTNKGLLDQVDGIPFYLEYYPSLVKKFELECYQDELIHRAISGE